ncbi:unnamed protein product, partial [Cladocopium goreaui]
ACNIWEHVEPDDSTLFKLPEDDIDAAAALECNVPPTDAEEVGRETMLYKYICHLRDSGAGSTTPSQLVEAMRFADNLMGFTQVRLQDMLSARVTGAAHSIFMTKRIRKPAEVLTVTEISELERICLNDDALHRRVIAGHLLFSFAAAARWHDSMYVVALESSEAGDIFLLEALTSKHKSSRGKEQQMELLPFTALGKITCDECWGQSWMDARQESHASTWNEFLCSWSESAHLWVESRMSTAEATGWLRELLEPHAGPDRARKLTVHGLKATLLSWAAKSTLFSADEQLALGHHVHAQYRSAMIYSRDNQIGLCKKLHDMFGKIRDGLFDPDATRVSRLFQLAYATMLENRGDESDSDATTDSDASSVASSDGEHNDIAQKPGYKRLDADDLEVELCLINNNSKVIHLLVSEDEKFWCGRHASASFRRAEVDDLAATEAVICANCSQAYRVAFQNRAVELGIAQADVEALSDSGINSYATYAYCCTFQPGQTDDTALTTFLATVLGNTPDAAATTRRSLAYDLSGIATFSVLDLWTQKLFEKMNEAPIANYRHISVEQVINADKALWVKVSNETRGKLQPKTGAEKPFDVAFIKFSEHAEVLQHLSPLQGHGGYAHDRAQTSPACCPQNHVHASWQPFRTEQGIAFPTAAEAEYPGLLCDRMAHCVLQMAKKLGVTPQIQPRLKDLLKLNMGQQTVRHPPLIPEYKTFVFSESPSPDPAYKLLAAPLQQGAESTEQLEHQETPRKRSRRTFKYGVRHSPEEFLHKATGVQHPMDCESVSHPITIEAIDKVVNTCPTKLAKDRLTAVFKIRKMSAELSQKERDLKATMHPDVRRCVQTKNVSLFECLLLQLGYWDLDVVNLLKHGVPPVGLQPAPEGYQKQMVPASMTEDELTRTAKWRRQAIMTSSRRVNPSEEKALLEATTEEVQRGFLQGPYTEDEMTVLIGSEDWTLNPRFVLFQGANNKVRVIDDAKQGAVNAAYSSTVKLQLQDVDYAAAMVMEIMRMSAGTNAQLQEWHGKTFDLSKLTNSWQCYLIIRRETRQLALPRPSTFWA